MSLGGIKMKTVCFGVRHLGSTQCQTLKPFEAGHFHSDEEAPERDNNLTEDYS